ncbi:uncharacterized protein V6R79_016799 [Siganus canaliculatus]
MARPLQVLPLLCRLGPLSVFPAAPSTVCHFSNRGACMARMGQSQWPRDRGSSRASRDSSERSDNELGLEDVEEKIQALVEEGKKRQKTVKYHMLRRQMTPSGAPLRKLTWDAMEQIRYLKREQPDEWTVERLAEGFSVTPDVILRVLKSKFAPSAERKVKQDAKIMARLGQQVLPLGARTGQGGLKLPGNQQPALLQLRGGEGAVLPVADRTLMLQSDSSGSLAKSPSPATDLSAQPRAKFGKAAPVTQPTEHSSMTDANFAEDNKIDEESWDGHLLTEEELEEFMQMAVEDPCPVVKVGKDFFDSDGNFLYRV